MLWTGFQRPKRLEFDLESLSDRYGKFFAQPFERGFAVTVGHAMRRVLLSSIEGLFAFTVPKDPSSGCRMKGSGARQQPAHRQG